MFNREDGALHFSQLKEWVVAAALRERCEEWPRRHGSLDDWRAFHALTLQSIEPVSFDFDRRGKKWEEFQELRAGKSFSGRGLRQGEPDARFCLLRPAACEVLSAA